ncbi:OLC1v1030955C1 [Oldenlandia corymbosa var. corymbosa]|uniref:OLC1v1030955C1 n=1 Tax=Oldenlandia corymbosa var. corymbosa TaxID=529605 RepID=A0AAV1CKA5_OLDCO|nr:OLC1v1030955C1 [Oldenlandia corymbosa var. corymbosa]
MELEGRGYSDLLRNTSEELFIKTMMESTIGMPAPTMEMLGFKNLSQNFRTDSEELFKSWLTTGENNGGNSGITHRTRQASRRISAEASNLSNQQGMGAIQRKKSDDNLFPQNTSLAGNSCELNQQQSRNSADKALQASNLFLAKAWFHSSQPMTRSRSSELRRRYVAQQTFQPAPNIETMPNISENGISNFKQEYNNPSGFSNGSMCEPNQINLYTSPSNSSSSNFNNSQMGNVDNISSVVSMLKGTLERKKLCSPGERETTEDSSFGCYGPEDVLGNSGLIQGQAHHIYEMPGTFQDLSTVQVSEAGILQTGEGSYGISLRGMVGTANAMQMSTVSREPSQSESSAPVVSTGFEVCDGPSISGQAPSVCESSRKQVGNDARQSTFDSKKDDRKKQGLVRYGSINSTGSGEPGDPTKKRRVERSRKMAEAKERNSTPVVPSDMQSILKRCENLEKEVRSLKLNLSFMNRKDSEQTKQIEELQKQNEDLSKEKERLLEEIERIISETAKM